MPNTQTIHVPHLGGIEAAYQTATSGLDPAKPTLVLVNSFTTSSELYKSQFVNKNLADSMNLLAIELLGHGQTRCKCEQWTYWDTAIMNLQVVGALEERGELGKGREVFVLGTSQGGWVTVRMALLAPEKITGIIPLGTSMDYESPKSRELGCWNAPEGLTPVINGWTSNTPTPDFQPGSDFTNFLLASGFGDSCTQEAKDFWHAEIARNYAGDDGRKRARMCTINLRDRDGLYGRLSDVRCPVMWMHGTSDKVYAFANAEREIGMFVNSPDATLTKVEKGEHFLSFSHPKEVDGKVAKFVQKYSKAGGAKLA